MAAWDLGWEYAHRALDWDNYGWEWGDWNTGKIEQVYDRVLHDHHPFDRATRDAILEGIEAYAMLNP